MKKMLLLFAVVACMQVSKSMYEEAVETVDSAHLFSLTAQKSSSVGDDQEYFAKKILKALRNGNGSKAKHIMLMENVNPWATTLMDDIFLRAQWYFPKSDSQPSKAEIIALLNNKEPRDVHYEELTIDEDNEGW